MISRAIKKGIIEPSELHELLQNNDADNIKILDGSFVLPTSAENINRNYYENHISNALFFDIKEIADHSSNLPHMLPSAEHFSSVVSRLGISNEDTIIVYGQSGMTMGPARVWWCFRAFGHKNICVLNGGLPAWIKEGFPLGVEKPAVPPPVNFEAVLHPKLVKNMQEMLEASQTETLILDARPASRFSGETEEPRSGMRAGHIPKSKSLPCMDLIDQETGKLKSAQNLNAIFKDAGYNSATPTIISCGSGITACVIALGLFHVGHSNIAVYDGSWSEWGHEDSNMPIESSA